MDTTQYKTLNQTLAHSRVGSRYEMIPTSRMLDILADYGWHPSKVSEARTRSTHNDGFQKHIVRLRNENQLPVQVGQYLPELVLKNSHMGSSVFELIAGIFQLVCANGLTVGESWQSEKVRHTGFATHKAENAIKAITSTMPQVIETVDKLRAVTLEPKEREAYAAGAIELIADKDNKYSMRTSDLLRPRRYADQQNQNTLWQTFNIVQENVIRGGVRRLDANNRSRRTRAVNNIDRNVALNRALWTLAEKMAELKH